MGAPAGRDPGRPSKGKSSLLGALAKAKTESQVKAILQAIDSLEAQERQALAQRVAQQRSIYAALQQELAPIAGQVEGIVNRQTQASTGFAKGFSDAMAQLANQSAGAANEQISGFGMPGQVQPQGTPWANTIYGEHGYIPATTFGSYGAAQAAAAAMLPGTARLQGEQQIGRMMTQFETEVMGDLRRQRAEVYANRPATEEEFLAGARRDAFELYEAGFMTTRELARKLGVKNWRQYPNTLQGEDGAFELREVGGSLYQVDPQTGQSRLVIQGPPDHNVRTFTRADGSDWILNLDTGEMSQIGGPRSNPPVRTGGPTTGYDLWDPDSGAYIGHVAATAPPGSSGTKVTPKLRAKARQMSKEAWFGEEDSVLNPLTGNYETKRGKRKNYQDAFDGLVAAGIPEMLAWRSLKKYYTKAPRPKVEPPLGGGNASLFTPPISWQGTHVTDNLDWNNGRQTARDFMLKAGTPVGAPEDGEIIRHSSAQGGQAMWFLGNSGRMYWLGHIDGMVPVKTKVRRGQRIAYVSADHPAPHLHIDVRF